VATVLPRIQVTETAALRQALAQASRAWPGLPKSKLVARLAEQGAVALGGSLEQEQAALAAMTKYSASYPEGYLDDLRSEWER
jgi:hypothetical protein